MSVVHPKPFAMIHRYRWQNDSATQSMEFKCGQKWRYKTRDFGTYDIDIADVNCLFCLVAK